MDVIVSLANQFQATLRATAILYVDLCDEPFALVFQKGGKLVWIHRSPKFLHWVSPGRNLSNNTHAADFLAMKEMSPSMETVRLGAWVGTAASERETIKEHSRSLASYNSVLTIFWIH